MIRAANAIVLRRQTDREADTTARLLLETGESLHVRMHGIRSSKQRSTLISEPGSLINITFYINENGSASLKEASVSNRFDDIKASYGDTVVLSALLECTAEAAKGEPQADLYELLLGALRR